MSIQKPEITEQVLDTKLDRDDYAAIAERICPWIVAAILLEFLVVGIVKAYYRPFWLDEIMGLLIAKSPSLSQIWNIGKTGADNQPLVYHYAMWTMVRLFGNDALGMRVPSVIGYTVFCLTLYLFVSRSTSSRLYGLIAMLFPGLTRSWWYATEGRPYALVLACLGVAAVCWQSINRDRHRISMLLGLGISFLFALNLHYFSVLLIVPLGIAEIARSYSRKKLDPAVWLSLLLPYLVLLFYIPIILVSRPNSGTPNAPFAKPSLYASFGRFAADFLSPALVFLILLAVFYLAVRISGRMKPGDLRSTAGDLRAILFPELYLVLAVSLLPLIAVLFARFGTHIFFTRYAIAGNFGFATLVGFCTWMAFSGSRKPALVVASASLILILATQLHEDLPTIRLGRSNPPSNALPQRFPKAALRNDLPIVFTNLDDFMQFVYYIRDEKLHNRLFYMASEPLAQRYLGFTIADRMMLGSSPFFHTQVVDYKSFISKHPAFYVFGSVEYWDWVIPKMLDDHVDLRLIQGGTSNGMGDFVDSCFRAEITNSYTPASNF